MGVGKGRPGPSREVPRDGKKSNPRLNFFYGVFLLLLVVLTVGLWAHQMLKGADYRAAEERQNYRRILMPGPRGNIYDREGRLLVGNRPVFNAVVSLNELRPEFRAEYFHLLNEARDRHQVIHIGQLNIDARSNVIQRYLNQINRVLGTRMEVDSVELERHFRQRLLLPFVLMSDLSGAQYAKLVEQISVESPIQVITESARYYPLGAAACHLLGYVSNSSEIPATEVPGEDLLTFTFEGKVGRSGLERSFDDRLQGISGGEIWSVDPGGFTYERTEFRSPVQGEDLTISIDIDLQKAAENALAGKIGAVVALDVNNGEVLALTSMPNYDLNDFSPFLSYEVDQKIRAEGGFYNRATQGLYPPGSTFKLVTAIAGMRLGIIDSETEIYCPGYKMVGRRRFHCHRRSGHGTEDILHAIKDSCNVFFYEKGIEMGIEPLAAEARRFGLDRPTGIELPGETRSMLIPDPAWKKRRLFEGWFDGDTANASIGQGYLLVTPLQMACFVASIARGETLTKPTLLLTSGQEISHPESTRIGLTAAQYSMIRQGMAMAGGPGGTARRAGTEDMPVAGKTGTAQVRKNGKPTTLAWFVGFAPAHDPEIAIAALVEGVPEEDTNYAGGSTAAPIAREVFTAFTRKRTPGFSQNIN